MTLDCNRSPYLFQSLVVFNSPSWDDVIYTTDFWSLTQILDTEWHIIQCKHLSSSFVRLPSFASFTNTSLVFHGQRVCPYSVVRAKRAVVSVHSLSDRLVLCGMICCGGGQAEKHSVSNQDGLRSRVWLASTPLGWNCLPIVSFPCVLKLWEIAAFKSSWEVPTLRAGNV